MEKMEKLQAAISSLEARIKAANEYLREEEQRAEEEGFAVNSLDDYNRIKSQLPVAKEKLRSLIAELNELHVADDEPYAKPAPTPVSEAPVGNDAPGVPDAPYEEPSIVTTPMEESATAGHTAILGISAESLTKRGFAFLEDSEWAKAGEKFDNALDINPEYARAYIGLLCVELKATCEANMANQDIVLTEKSNFNKALRYASDDYKTALESFNRIIVNRHKQREEALRRQEEEEKRQEAEEERRLAEKRRKLEEDARLKEEEKKKAEEELKKKEKEQRELQAEQRRAEIKLKEAEEQRLIEEEQEYRKNQREWQKKGLCYYCGGKLSLLKKCADCGKKS